MRSSGDRDLRGKNKEVVLEDTKGRRKVSRFFDLLCAGALFVLAIAAAMLIPKTYTDRVWIYGSDLALLFAAMLNLLRIQNASLLGVRAFCITANFAMSAFFIALMISIGLSQTLSNAQIPAVAALLLLETAFSVRKHT